MKLGKVDPEIMKKAIRNYSAWDRDIVVLFFGLDDGYTCSVEDIADLCGVSKQTVISVAKKALKDASKLMKSEAEGSCVCPMLPGGIIEHTQDCAYMKRKK